MREKPEIKSENILLVKLINGGTNGEIRFGDSELGITSSVVQYKKDTKYHKKIANFVKRSKDDYFEVHTGTHRGGSYEYINKNLVYSSLQVCKSWYGGYEFYILAGKPHSIRIQLGLFKDIQEFCSKSDIPEEVVAPLMLKLEVEEGSF